MKKDVKDFIGKRFNNVTVIGQDVRETHFNANHWVFICDCGKEFSDRPSRILSGHRKSCGCQKVARLITHGLNGDEFYHTWWSMMQRCYNKEHHNYQRYGGRGIVVCEAWQDPANFIQWARETIGHKKREMTVDRIDVNGNYCPENCRWATAKEQQNNMRTNRKMTIDGITKNITEWCTEYGISTQLANARMKAGMSFEEALKTPKRSPGRKKAAQ